MAGLSDAEQRYLDRVAEDDRGRAGGLEAEHPRPPFDDPGHRVVGEAGPVRADVASIADRDREDVGRPTEVVADLERGRLLAGQAVRVDGVHEGDRVIAPVGELEDDRERLVEVAFDGHDPAAGDDSPLGVIDRLGLHLLPNTAGCYTARDAVLTSCDLDLSAGLDYENKLFALSIASGERDEGVRAFREKRKPKFRGTR